MDLLAISGSLRANSFNSSAIEALKELSPDNIKIHIGSIGDLPLFNPDLEEQEIRELEEIKRNLSTSQGLIIASPEYAHGVSGPMKNALDWLVSGDEFPGKKVMLINTSPRASHAENALKEIIKTMSGVIVESAYVSIPLLGSGLDKDGILENQQLAKELKIGLNSFSEAIRQNAT